MEVYSRFSLGESSVEEVKKEEIRGAEF